VALLELFARNLATDQPGEAQDRLVEPDEANRRACPFRCVRSEQLDWSPFVAYRQAAGAFVASRRRYQNIRSVKSSSGTVLLFAMIE